MVAPQRISFFRGLPNQLFRFWDFRCFIPGQRSGVACNPAFSLCYPGLSESHVLEIAQPLSRYKSPLVKASGISMVQVPIPRRFTLLACCFMGHDVAVLVRLSNLVLV